MNTNDTKWGIDLGGTKIEGVILDQSNHPIYRHRIATEADQGYQHIVGRIKLMVKELEAQSGLICPTIGIGTPGSLDKRSGLMKNSNTTALIGKPLKKDVEAALDIPIKLTNDANCFAMAEALMGVVPDEVPDAQVIFGVIMGTGVGGGIVVNGQVIDGLHGIAGEWGHNTLIEQGVDCYCGKKGCVEKVLAGPSLERFYREVSGESRKLAEIVQLAKRDEDPFAQQTLDRLVHYFGKAISVIINILDPDVIVLGGGVSNIDDLYSRGPAAAETFVFNGQLNTPILRPKLGDSAGVFGAALL